MKKSPKSQYKIRFIDCDPLGHLTNSRYIDYMLNAREDHVNKAYNLDYFEYSQQTGNAWVAYENRITYLREVKFNALVTIVSQIIDIQDTTAIVEIIMYNEAQTKVHAVLWTTVVHMNLFQRKRESHSEEIKALFNQVHLSIPQKTYEERMTYFRSLNKAIS